MENYKRWRIVLLLCVAVLAACAGTLLFFSQKTVPVPNYTPNANTNTIEKTDNLDLCPPNTGGQTDKELSQPLYTAGIYQGQVALFAPGSELPEQVLPVYVAHLPVMDQQTLNEGLPLYTQEEVASFLEDFGS